MHNRLTTIPKHWWSIVAIVVLFDVFALARVAPVNSSLPENDSGLRGDHDRNVRRILELAVRHAGQPFTAVSDHALNFKRSPALFIFVAELFVRLGARTSLPVQLFSIVLWDIGLVAFFSWLLLLFDSALAATAGMLFLITTPFALFNSVSLHHEPYAFASCNVAVYCFLRHLREEADPRWLPYAWLAFFVSCLNYWHYYVGTYLMFIALQVRENKLSLRTSILMASSALAGFLVTALQVAYANGGVGIAYLKLTDILAARSRDIRIEGTEWDPKRRYLFQAQINGYPHLVAVRIQQMMGYSTTVFAWLATITCVLAGKRVPLATAWKQYRFLPIVVLGGLSWNLMMMQHTVIHEFSGMYGYFAWTVIVTGCAFEVVSFASAQISVRWLNGALLSALALALLYSAASHVYVPFLERYATNIVTPPAPRVPANVSPETRPRHAQHRPRPRK